MARTVPVYTAPTNRYLTDFWGLFDTVLPVNDTHTNVLVEGLDQRVAKLQAQPVVEPLGNDRRLFLLDESFQATDAEAYLTVEGVGSYQTGVVLRVQPGGSGHLAPLVWTNVFFGTTANLIPGVWEFSGTVLTTTNQQANPANGSFEGYPRAISSVTGDGTTITVSCAERHLLDLVPNATGVTVLGNPLLPANPFVFVTDVVSPFVFRFPGTQVGTQAGGRLIWQFWPGVRTLAVRLVGSTLTGKQWPSDYVPEPAWTDPLKVGSVTLPGTLAGGVLLPSGPGRAGFVAAHLGGSGQLLVRRFEVNKLA